jgi:hypothetical protein
MRGGFGLHHLHASIPAVLRVAKVVGLGVQDVWRRAALRGLQQPGGDDTTAAT